MQTDQIPEQQQQPKLRKTLSIKGLFSNFFLLHDFFYKLTKLKPQSAQFFDMQYDAATTIINATKSGGRFTQGATLFGLSWYFIRGNSIPVRFVMGAFYWYWITHLYTLGSYAGVLVVLPSVYRRTNQYFESNPKQHNYFDDLAPFMDQGIEDTQAVMSKIFPDSFIKKSYTKNDYFAKNWEKYEALTQNNDMIARPTLKLSYFDCFLTRYIYHSFARWVGRFQQFTGFKDD